MTDLRQAAEMALEALESLDCGDSYKTHNAASALRQAQRMKITRHTLYQHLKRIYYKLEVHNIKDAIEKGLI